MYYYQYYFMLLKLRKLYKPSMKFKYQGKLLYRLKAIAYQLYYVCIQQAVTNLSNTSQEQAKETAVLGSTASSPKYENLKLRKEKEEKLQVVQQSLYIPHRLGIALQAIQDLYSLSISLKHQFKAITQAFACPSCCRYSQGFFCLVY